MRRFKGATLGDVLDEYLNRQGMKERVEQAKIVLDWKDLVGPKLAAVCQPVMVDRSGTLWVRVQSSAWMQELQLMSPTIIRELARRGRRIKQIRWAGGQADIRPPGRTTRQAGPESSETS